MVINGRNGGQLNRIEVASDGTYIIDPDMLIDFKTKQLDGSLETWQVMHNWWCRICDEIGHISLYCSIALKDANRPRPVIQGPTVPPFNAEQARILQGILVIT